MTAGVVGLIGATAVQMIPTVLTSPSRIAIALLALIVLIRSNSRAATPCVIAASALAGLALC